MLLPLPCDQGNSRFERAQREPPYFLDAVQSVLKGCPMDRVQVKTFLQAIWREQVLSLAVLSGAGGCWLHCSEWLMCRLHCCLADGQIVLFLGLSFPILQRASQGKAFGDQDPLLCPALSHHHYLPLCPVPPPPPWELQVPDVGDAMIRNIC